MKTSPPPPHPNPGSRQSDAQAPRGSLHPARALGPPGTVTFLPPASPGQPIDCMARAAQLLSNLMAGPIGARFESPWR